MPIAAIEEATLNPVVAGGGGGENARRVPEFMPGKSGWSRP